MKIRQAMNDSIKSLLLLLLLIAMGYGLGLAVGYFDYKVVAKVKQDGVVYIPTGSTLKEQAHILYNKGFLQDTTEIINLASKLRSTPFGGGQYLLKKGMTFSEVFSILGGGRQVPTNITFNNVYDKYSLAGKVSATIEMDSVRLVALFNNDSLLKNHSLKPENVIFTFIPNTYEVYWDINEDELISKMKDEYNRFWGNSDRIARLKMLDMTREEVMTLASIVDEETNLSAEMPIIAGVYINRLNRGMLLQADPTVKYAFGDRTLRRVLDKHLEIDSPYNTYKYKGLPPNPITIPSIAAIDAVLNYKPNRYLYFCASDKLDGTHLFSRTLSEHKINARKYARALNKAKIYK